ncbi:MAG: hypothetical protein MO852_13070 [Candidatus Devosia euplotis]|nr:hypothetical protein [Candidatus Devosia euplotis]
MQAFGDEQPINVGLEEVRFDDAEGSWKMTIGFSRPWDNETPIIRSVLPECRRVYKVVTIDDVSGEAISIIQREIAA